MVITIKKALGTDGTVKKLIRAEYYFPPDGLAPPSQHKTQKKAAKYTRQNWAGGNINKAKAEISGKVRAMTADDLLPFVSEQIQSPL